MLTVYLLKQLPLVESVGPLAAFRIARMEGVCVDCKLVAPRLGLGLAPGCALGLFCAYTVATAHLKMMS